MYLRINKLKMQNFLAWKNFSIIFDNGVNLIQGSNGVGKSAIIDAISVALFNKPIRNINIADIVNKDATFTIIELEGILNKKPFKIKYKRTLSDKSSTYKVKFIYDNEEYTNINEIKIRLKQEGLTYLHWKSLTAITPQTIPVSIGDYRYIKQSLETFLNFEEFDGYAQKISEIHKEYSEKTTRLENGLREANSLIRQYNNKIKEIESKVKEANLKLTMSNIDELTQQYNELKEQLEYIHSELDNLQQQTSVWQTLLAKKQTYSEQKITYNTVLKSKIKNLSNIQKQLKKLESDLLSIKDKKCPVCGQSLPNDDLQEVYLINIKDAQQRYEQAQQEKNEIAHKLGELDRKLGLLKIEIDKIKPLQDKYASLAKTESQVKIKFLNLEKKIKQLRLNPDALHNTIDLLSNELKVIKKNKKNLQGITITYLKNKLEDLNAIKLLLYHTKQALTSKKNRALLVKDELSYVFSQLNKALEMFNLEYSYKLAFEFNPEDIAKYKVIVEGDVAKQIDGLSSGQMKLISVLFSIIMSLLYRSKYGNTNLLFLDDVFDTLDRDKIQDLVDFISKLPLESVYILSHLDLSLPGINTINLTR